MIQINQNNGRLSAWGTAASTASIRWQKQPSNLPVAGQPLDLRGLQIYADFSDGTSEDITEFCSFTPSQGTPIYDEHFVNVTASYVEKSGKTITADASLPVCYPAELRLVVSEDVLNENYFDTDSPYFNPDTMPLKKGMYKPYCVWKRVDPRTEQEVIIRISPVPEEDMHYTYNLERDGSDVFYTEDFLGHKWWIISSIEKIEEDVENWHNPYTPTIESFERPLVVSAQASVPGDVLFATGYFETNPIKLTYVNLPATFEDGVPTHFTKDNIRFSWGDSDPVLPVEGFNDWRIGLNFGVPIYGSNPQDELDYTFENGDELDFCPTRQNPGFWNQHIESEEPYEYTRYHCKCEGNKFNWTIIEE